MLSQQMATVIAGPHIVSYQGKTITGSELARRNIILRRSMLFLKTNIEVETPIGDKSFPLSSKSDFGDGIQ